MFRPFFKGASSGFSANIFTSCDEADLPELDDFDTPSLIEEADAAIENQKLKIKTPMQYENLRNTMSQGSVNAYDGFRVMVQKQINLNTVVSHFYWVGSQATGAPIYQYRLILPIDDDKCINVATDMDFNIEGEVKGNITPDVAVKTNFTNGEQQKNISFEMELTDECSATQLKYARMGEDSVSVGYMQALLPTLSVGGSGAYSMGAKNFATSLGFIYDPAEFTLAAQYDNGFRVMYLRKVNPNRVHVCTDLQVDGEGQSQMSLSAEFMLKQSKIQMGFDSNMMLKSYLETNMTPSTQLQLCAEMNQPANHYRFGFGILMG